MAKETPWRGPDGPRFANQGPDKRFSGPLGYVAAWLQWTLSFHSSTPPVAPVYRRDDVKLGIEFSRPWLLPFLIVFLPHRRVIDKPRWYSFRAGWRWDPNWGNASSPDHAYFVARGWQPGGYIFDVIIKLRIDNMVGWLLPILLACGLVAGCAKKVPPTVVRIVEPVEVKVPVPVVRVPPAELMAPLMPPLPAFVAPADPNASSALTAEGERLLRALINDLLTRIAAWEAWAREAP